MITRFLILSSLLAVMSAEGAVRNWLLIEITNNTVTGDSITINSDTRTWTNATSSSTVATNAAGTATAAKTNLFSALASYRIPQMVLQDVSTNSFRLFADLGVVITASAVGNWATLTTNGQSGPITWPALYPLENIIGETNRTNQASSFVSGINQFATNSFATNATALSNFLNTGAAAQTIPTNKVIHGGSLSNVHSLFIRIIRSIGASEFNLSNVVAHTLVSTNGINYGNAFSSKGSANLSEQFGAGATATGPATLAVGWNASATNQSAVAIGAEARVWGSDGIALGTSAQADGTNGIAIGLEAVARTNNTIAIGREAQAEHTNSIVLAHQGQSSTNNQVTLGSSSQYVRIPGVLQVEGSISNLVTSVGTNKIQGDLSFPWASITSLGNGNNIAVSLGTNHFVSLDGTITADSALNGFTGGRSGLAYQLRNNTGYTLTLSVDTPDPTEANRIVTTSGANVAMQHGAFAWVAYHAGASRWLVTSVYPTSAVATNAADVLLTADNQSVSVTNRSVISLSSDSAVAGDRTFVLSTGTARGAKLTLEWSGTNAGEIADNSALTGGGNARLSATWTPTQYDVLDLIFNGTDWIERSRSAN